MDEDRVLPARAVQSDGSGVARLYSPLVCNLKVAELSSLQTAFVYLMCQAGTAKS